MEDNKTSNYEKEIEEMCKAYENATDDDFRDSDFKMAYNKAIRSLHFSKWDEFKEYCYKNERFRKYYKISFGEKEFNQKFVKVFEADKTLELNDKEQKHDSLEEKNSENTDEFDFDDSKWTDNDESDDTNKLSHNTEDSDDDDRIRICPSCNTQMGFKVFICPKCGLRCGPGTISTKADLEIDKKIDDFKKQFQKTFDKDYKGVDWDPDLLINKISASIRKHSSSDLKQYLRDYTEKPMCKNIKSEYDKAMNICCCSDIILKILNGLKEVFKDDELALQHVEKCYRSIDQLLYEKTKLAEKLKTEEEKDEFNFDDDTDDDEFNFDIDDEEEDDSKDNADDWPWDDDNEEDNKDFNFDVDDSDDDETQNKKEQIDATATAIVNAFYKNEKYSTLDLEQLVYGTTNILKNDDVDKIDEFLAEILTKIVPSKDWDTLNNSVEYSKVFHVVYFTCEEIGKLLNTKNTTNFINRTLKKYKQLWDGKNQIIADSISQYTKKYKAKQNLKKVGRFLGTVALSPLIAAAKVAEWSDEYSQRPEVQEKRRIAGIRYYCKFCGREFLKADQATYTPCYRKAEYDRALSTLEGTANLSHHYCQIYEGGQKSEYECRICRKKAKSIFALISEGPCQPKVRANNERYHKSTSPEILAISRHEPAL